MIPDADVRRVLFEQVGGETKGCRGQISTRSPISENGVIADINKFGIGPGETATDPHARVIILAAGALGSPTILLRSGVHNDEIGRGMILHPLHADHREI